MKWFRESRSTPPTKESRDADARLHKLAGQLAKREGIRYADALRRVARKHAELAEQWRRGMPSNRAEYIAPPRSPHAGTRVPEIRPDDATYDDAQKTKHSQAFEARIRAQNRAAALRRGKDLRENVAKLDHAIREHANAYRSKYSHDRQHSTRALAVYLATRLGRPAGTIRRRLRELNIR